jgi:hypothetical protein
MPLSLIRLQLQLIVAAVKAFIKHFTSRDYPKDWDLRFHVQFAVSRRLLGAMNDWTVEEVSILSEISKFHQLQSFPMKFVLEQPRDLWTFPISIEYSDTEKRFFESEMRKVIEFLGDGVNKMTIQSTTVKGEWQGLTEKEMQKVIVQDDLMHILEDKSDCPIILWTHGGGAVAGTAAEERPVTCNLLKLTGALVFSIDYRLAPQNPFPSGLLDVLVAYNFLINPPAGALHKPIDPNRIIVAGDSAGVLFLASIMLRNQGCLAIAFMAFLAFSKTFPFPSGFIAVSPAVDITDSFPSTRTDRGLDFLPCPWENPYRPKKSAAWPTVPPRTFLYSDVPLHPLVLSHNLCLS